MARLLFLPSLLLSLLLLLKPSYTDALTSAELPVAARTHTFNSYLQDPVFTALVPVFVATALQLAGVYCQDEVKALNGGLGLALGPDDESLLGASPYTIKNVFQSPRRRNAFKSIGTKARLLGQPYFAFKQEAGKIRLMVNMQALNEQYTRLEGNRRRELLPNTHNKNNSSSSRAANRLNGGIGYYYDPAGQDDVSPYFPGLTDAEIRRIERLQAKQAKKDRRDAKKEERAWARYDKWVIKQLGGRIKGGMVNMTVEQVVEYYIEPTNKKYPYKYGFLDNSGEYVDISKRPQDAETAGVASVAGEGAAVASSGGEEGDDEVEIENLTASSYIYDYVIIFAGPDGVLKRLDLTIVPKVFRKSTLPTGFLCKPDGSTDPVKLSSYLKDYMPRTDTCTSHTIRSAPYALSSPEFAALHPEEANWLPNRLDKTALLVKKFVEDLLPGKTLNIDTEARLKIAFSNTGGGKRATFHSLGVTKTLYELGIFDHAAWVSGLSGGGWYLTAHYLAMLDKMQTVNPKTVFDDLKDKLRNSMFGDDFEMNNVFTDVAGPPFYPSRLGAKNSTDEIFCEGELKLQSPLTYPERSASLVEYWSRAITFQTMPSSSPDIRGLGVTLSSFASSPLLSSHSAPLPLFQIHENKGDGSSKDVFRLWEVSPFDVTTNEMDVHASFPTALLGSTAQSTTSCTLGLDSVSYLQGISSYALGGFPPGAPAIFCGIDIWTGKTGCQATGLQNPFEGFADISSSDLFTKKDLFVTDGGLKCNLPIWMFLSPTRQADIVFAIDAGGSSGTKDPTFSTDTSPDPKTCPLDTASQTGYDCPTRWTGTSCCDECVGAAAALGIFGCFSVNDPSDNSIFKTLENYIEKMPVNSVPPYPKADGTNYNKDDPKSQFGRRVLIFGCDNVQSKTPIVTIPNRIVKSGQSGHDTLKGSANIKLGTIFGVDLEFLRPEQQYLGNDVENFFQNAAAALPSLPGLPDFPKCIACLYYAKATGQDNFMRTDSDCSACYTSYCWVPSS